MLYTSFYLNYYLKYDVLYRNQTNSIRNSFPLYYLKFQMSSKNYDDQVKVLPHINTYTLTNLLNQTFFLSLFFNQSPYLHYLNNNSDSYILSFTIQLKKLILSFTDIYLKIFNYLFNFINIKLISFANISLVFFSCSYSYIYNILNLPNGKNLMLRILLIK